MKATRRKIRGRNAWEVLIDGKVVGEVFKQGTADGLFLPFRPAVLTGEVDAEDEPVARVLEAQSTLAGAVEAVRLAATTVSRMVSDRVEFVGVGVTQDMADKLVAGIRRRLEDDSRPTKRGTR